VTRRTPSKEYPAELRQILDRASNGDAAVLPELSAAFDRHPELTEALGDLLKHAESILLAQVAGQNLAGREAIARQLREMRARLQAEAGSELERLLAGRLCLDWLVLQQAQIDLAAQRQAPPGGPVARAAQHNLNRAHARFLAASKTLATVQRLLRRAPSPLDLLRPAAEGRATQAGRGPSVQRPELAAALC
jgi:hypothetical protein